MTPEMWLDLEPIPHCASHNFAADRQKSLGDSARCCLAGCLAGYLTFYCVKGATFLVTVSRLGGLGHQFLFTICMPSATGCDALPLRGLCGSDESCLGYGVADETARGQHSVLVRALLSSHWSVTDG